MANRRLVAEKVSDYLKALSPDARALLVKNIERAKASGTASAQHEIILEAARAHFKRVEESVTRLQTPERLFFLPYETFIISEELTVFRTGRISRKSIRAIWTWMSRDLEPELITRTERELTNAIEHNMAQEVVEQHVKTMHDTLIRSAFNAVKATADDSLLRQKLIAQLGGEAVHKDLLDLLRIFEVADELDAFKQALPRHIKTSDQTIWPKLTRFVDKVVRNKPTHGIYFYVQLMNHFDHTSGLVTLARKLAGTDNVLQIEASAYQNLLDLGLAEIERCILVLRSNFEEVDRNAQLHRFFGDYNALVKAIDTQLDLKAKASTTRKLGDLRSMMSDYVSDILKRLPIDIRTIFKDPTAIDPGFLESAEHENTLYHLYVMKEAIRHKDSMAINSIVSAKRSEIERILEQSMDLFLGKLLDCPAYELESYKVLADACVQYCIPVFGPDYAALRVRNRDNALKSRTAA